MISGPAGVTDKSICTLSAGTARVTVVALAGNPNTGKSTVFNSLTGLRQHTGNWPGKTVAVARGHFRHHNRSFKLVDLPGTYSLLAKSAEEEVTRDFILYEKPDAIVIITDATCLERNLNLTLQILEITKQVVLCVNLIDEAVRKRISVDLTKLSALLGVPVIGTSAREGAGLDELRDAIWAVSDNLEKNRSRQVCYPIAVEQAVARLERALQGTGAQPASRWFALRLLEREQDFLQKAIEHSGLGSKQAEKLARAAVIERAALEKQKPVTDLIVSCLVREAEAISRQVVRLGEARFRHFDRRVDDVVTSRTWGIPIMILLLGVIFWITITGANYPSAALAAAFNRSEVWLSALFAITGWPEWLHGMLVSGVFRTLGWVISVMLPPMAIFFPLFTLLEDLGYLPRVAFNLDHFFKIARAHGKQALTMCMGFGCNAVGVIACRIIDSPRERLIAVLTNNFVPCNGRFPTLVALASIFIAAGLGVARPAAAAATVLGAVLFGGAITLAVSKILSHTFLKGLPSSFTLELPPYRKPQVGRILIRSLLDRTLFVLGRAVVVAAPAGVLIWFAANFEAGGVSLLNHGAQFLEPFARLLGLDGFILIAFILGLPANEIVIPIMIMSYLATGSMLELETLDDLQQLLMAQGWTGMTALCTMLFSLNHFPCGTTLLTIYRETGSWKWTAAAFAIPTVTGIVVCLAVAQGARLVGLG